MTRRLAQVAKKVGVSEATVSRVLNGKPGVSEATRQSVLSALDVLGYERPTQLRGERARLVGLVLP
ncbi:LacI family transcriptional regulator, partial [Streptomyces sp. alain-838]